MFRFLPGVLAVSLAVPAFAQTYPAGACVLPSGQWCIPPVVGTAGTTCSCLTSGGWQSGTQN